ncbi:MAG: MBOAT family protein [Polyangiaceae bacterium]|nr:MBOAT family protein [Polyangiaceae bacterium]
MRLAELFEHDPSHPLLFNSGTFLLFFTGFVALYAVLVKSPRARLAWLLAFSLFYYYRSNGLFMLTLVALAAIDWAIGLAIHAEERPGRRKALLTTSIVSNLTALGYFKYTNFFLGTAASVAGRSFEPIDIFLPLGISFHVFQSLSYLVDVYRRRYAPTRSLFEYTLFLSFFPQIVAGPIVRAPEFFSQIHPLREPSHDDIAAGLYRVIQGLVKKALIADYVGLYADVVFATPSTYTGPETLLAIYAYAIQIYFDFSGYSDMALGMARTLGMQIPENFDSPYRATSVTEFWRRWHISLSSWLREYLYVSLGGNRRGKARQMVNLMVTMLLGGLWHGASWTFVVWGGLHGAALAVEKLLGIDDRRSRAGKIVGWVLTIHFVAALWVFFRAQSFEGARAVFEQLGSGWQVEPIGALLRARRWLVAVIGLAFVGSIVPRDWPDRLQSSFEPLPPVIKAVVFVAVIQLVVQSAGAEVQPFIYFQF